MMLSANSRQAASTVAQLVKLRTRRAHRDRISARSALIRIKKATQQYGIQLRKIARHIDDIVKGFDASTPEGQNLIQRHLRRYADTLDHWAESAADLMLARVSQADQERWRRQSQEISRGLEREIQSANVAPAMAQMKAEQVQLIKSLPASAAERVSRIATEGVTKGLRAEVIAQQIYETGAVTRSRSTLIAETEIGRAATTLQMARAQSVGSTAYIWRTTGDAAVRHDHKILDGQTFRWDSPPVADQRTGARAHPGCIYRCFPGDVQVSLGNGITKIWRMPFNDQIAEIVTELGATTATPNHPILTQRGWVSAGEIGQGDYLVQALDDAHLIINRHENEALPTFDEVFRAFGAAYPTQRESGLRSNFYGYVPDGNVDQIVIDPRLTLNLMAKRDKRISKFALADADALVGSGGIGGGLSHSSASSIAGFVDESAAFGGGHSGHSQGIGGAASTNSAALTFQPSFDDVARHVEGNGQGQGAFTAQVAFDNLRYGKLNSVMRGSARAFDHDPTGTELLAQNVGMNTDGGRSIFECGSRRYKLVRVTNQRFRNHSGHVYTIETKSGWYSVASAGFVAMNCRCIAEPIIAD